MARNRYGFIFALLFIQVVVLFNEPAIANFSDQYGSYAVSVIEDTGPDWNQDGIGDFFIYHPTDMIGGSHPIIIFCVGTGANPETSYGEYLREYASHGFVIIAGTDKNQKDGDQAVCGLDYIVNENSNPDSIFYNKLDTSSIMAMGHSQGGNACLHVAIKDKRIISVLALMPAKGMTHDTTTADATKLDVPVFYVSGMLDHIVWPYCVYAKYYYKTKSTDAWFGETKMGHSDCSEGIDYTLRAWMYYQLYHDEKAESLFHWNDYFTYAELNPQFQWYYITRNF